MDMIAIFNFRLMLKSEGLVKREVRGLGTTKDNRGMSEQEGRGG